MIINTMSIEEMETEVEKDSNALYAKIRHLGEENRRFYIKSTKFPAYKTFKWTSRITNNEWNIIILARDKKETPHPAFIPYVKYQSYGVGVVYMRPVDERILTITYTPHLFHRYRERYLGESGNGLTTDEIINDMFIHSSIPTYDFTSAKDKFVIHIAQGLILGDYNDDRTRLTAKTFVAKDMLFSSQESVDSEAVEMIELIKKSVQYKTNQKSPYGVDGITGEIFEARLF